MPRAAFGLDRIVVERRALPPTRPFVCILPPPISVNEMFGQRGGRQRFNSLKYTAWIKEANLRLDAARPPCFPGQVWIWITYSDVCRFDTDNAHKGIIDLLKKRGVIVNDTKKYVRQVICDWGQNDGARVEVSPNPFAVSRVA